MIKDLMAYGVLGAAAGLLGAAVGFHIAQTLFWLAVAMGGLWALRQLFGKDV